MIILLTLVLMGQTLELPTKKLRRERFRQSLAARNLRQDRTLFKAALWAMFKGKSGRAITGFLLLAGRFKRSPFTPWSLYFAATLNEEKGDFLAARRNYERAIQAGHPARKALQERMQWLEAGIKSGGSILMRESRRLYRAKVQDHHWEKSVLEFLSRAKKLVWNHRLRLLLAQYYLQSRQVKKASFVLEKVVFEDKGKSKDKALKALFPLLVSRGEEARLRKMAKVLKSERASWSMRMQNASNTIAWVKRLNAVFWGVFGMLCLFLLFPLKRKRYNRILFLALLAPALAWIPDVGLFLGLVLVHFIFLLWLYGKRRPLWVKVPWAVGMFYIPFLALILSGSFPYQLLL